MKLELKKLTRNTLGGVLLHLFIAFGVIMLLGVLYFFAYLPGATNHGESITVPNIEGKSIEEADKFLASHDLRYEVNDSSYSDQYPPLTVLKQYPKAGSKVKEDRKIYVSINRINPPTVPMPNLIDASVIGAEALLKANELKRGRIELVAGPFNVIMKMKYQGVVIPAETRVPKGAVIDLVVADGGNNCFALGDVVGSELEDAKVSLFGSNLNMNVTVIGDTTGITPVVLKQNPAAGETICVGDAVDVIVGKAGTSLSE